MNECNEPAPEFTAEERAFLETYSMLLRLLFAARSVTREGTGT